MKFITTPYTIESLPAYQQAGCDAIILATPFFSVRGAAVFAEADLPKWKAACTQLGMEMLVLVNRFFCEEELDALRKHLQYLKDLDVDGIYFTDEGVLYIAKQLGMEQKMIYYPDTLLTNHLDVNFYVEQGLHSVVLAKEITLEEILEIAQNTNSSKLELIIHGRLNMMHSKRKLLTNYFSFMGKDIDIQGKRNLYLMEETREEHMPIFEDDLGTHVFSGYTQVFFEEIEALAKAGIGYVRIDGIFHDDAYALEALALYQAILKKEKNGKEVRDSYALRYPQDHIQSGFLYTKTSKSK